MAVDNEEKLQLHNYYNPHHIMGTRLQEAKPGEAVYNAPADIIVISMSWVCIPLKVKVIDESHDCTTILCVCELC